MPVMNSLVVAILARQRVVILGWKMETRLDNSTGVAYRFPAEVSAAYQRVMPTLHTNASRLMWSLALGSQNAIHVSESTIDIVLCVSLRHAIWLHVCVGKRVGPISKLIPRES